MSSIQERLQLKRIPLDTWNVREQLCLASAVVRSGDQNWMSVSRALKTVGEANRPPDWYSQKSCAAQYGALLEHVETPKRKKRSSEGAVETPQESILKKLTQERIVEIQKTVAEMNQQYEQLKNEITELRTPSTSDDRIREMWSAIEAAKRTREREAVKRAAWLKEREERRARAERTWRPPAQPQSAPVTPPPPSSPLLTSLLKSSPVVTTPQLMPHPANVVETISPSAGAPTLSMLLEKAGAAQDPKHAAIEHIKSQLVKIEQQYNASTSSTLAVPLAPPAVDIDDIEIKAEDVYAFRDIDLHIPPVATMHKGAPRVAEKIFKKDEDAPAAAADDVKAEETEPDTQKETSMQVEENVVHDDSVRDETVAEERTAAEAAAEQAPEPPPVKIAFPEVKFPTPEIKVIQPEEHKQVKEDVKEPEAPPPEPDPEPPAPAEEATPELVEEKTERAPSPAPEPPAEAPPLPSAAPPMPPVPPGSPPAPPAAPPSPGEAPGPGAGPGEGECEELPGVLPVIDPDSIPLPPDPAPAENIVVPEQASAPLSPCEAPPQPPEPPAESPEPPAEVKVEPEEVPPEHIKREDDAEDSMPLKEMMKECSPAEVAGAAAGAEAEPAAEPGAPPAEPLEPHADTDDDTPMEVRMLSREEEKDGKKKRDYSRKKKSDSRTCSGSESAAEASAPESPHASDAERQHRLWKRSVMLVYSRLCAHKYASLFLRPISDEEAPGYSVVVKRPCDLSTIKKNIEAGHIRTTAEFQRDVLLMLSNALMYNSSEHSVYQMAKELYEEAQNQLGMLLAAQAHAGLASCAPPRRKRRRADSPPPRRRH